MHQLTPRRDDKHRASPSRCAGLRPRLQRLAGALLGSAGRSVLLLCVAAPAVPPGAWGNGRKQFDPATNKFNMVISVRFAATAMELDQIRDAFVTASGILLDARRRMRPRPLDESRGTTCRSARPAAPRARARRS